MSEAATYPVGTIHQMAAIPVEAQARFLAELPSLLEQVRHMNRIKAQFEAQFGKSMKLNLEDAGDPTWIDDDLGTATISVELPDGGKISVDRRLSPAEPA